jgi:Mg-chelatase subunit ChlD
VPTVPVRRGADPVAEVLAEGRRLRRGRIGCVIAEVAEPEHGCAAALAQASGGTRLPLSALAADLVLERVEESA